MGKCIECKSEFNRAASTDKLRCQACQKSDDLPEWKKNLKKKKVKK